MSNLKGSSLEIQLTLDLSAIVAANFLTSGFV
jgi:hypothetical protein